MQIPDATSSYLAILSALMGVETVVLLRWRKHLIIYFIAAISYLAAAAYISYRLANDMFDLLRLASFAVFLGGPLLCFMAAFAASKKYKLFCKFFVGLGIIAVGVTIDAFIIEPHWLDIEHIVIHSDKVNKPFTIAVVSDFQTDDIGEYEKSVLRSTMNGKPDVILFPGDYVQELDGSRGDTLFLKFNRLLKDENVSAPMGCYAVGGNVEGEGDWRGLFAGVPVTTFFKSGSVEAPDFVITGLSMHDSFDTKIRIPARKKLHIVFGHGPDFALGKVEADLLVAGHTHGGQVQVPIIGPLVTLSMVPRKWAAGGATSLSDDKTLVVSRGIGMERGFAPRLRFMCRPHLIFIHMEKKN